LQPGTVHGCGGKVELDNPGASDREVAEVSRSSRRREGCPESPDRFCIEFLGEHSRKGGIDGGSVRPSWPANTAVAGGRRDRHPLAHGRIGCDGDTVSITAATQPSIEDIILGAFPGLPKVNLHNPVLARENGHSEKSELKL
jgi:hypothetical protein